MILKSKTQIQVINRLSRGYQSILFPVADNILLLHVIYISDVQNIKPRIQNKTVHYRFHLKVTYLRSHYSGTYQW